MPEKRRTWSRRGALAGAAGATATAALTGRAGAGPVGAGLPAADRGRTANGRIHELRAGRHRVLVAGVAATLLSWRVDGEELLLTHPADEVGEGYQGKTILPWPNRIDRGRYSFGGRQLQVPINEPSNDAALHGLVLFEEWRPLHRSDDRVVLEHVLHPSYGYPFALTFRVEYAVDEGGLRRTLATKNVGTTDAPYGTATHTYIAASTGTVDSVRFELPADTYYRTNERLIPTGTAPVAGTEYDFRTARPLGETTMDTAFTGLRREDGGNAVVRFDRPGGASVRLWADDTHDYFQVYTDDEPDTDRPPRAGIAVEPMTCAPNAFVTGDGLIALQPGEVHESSWGYQLED